MKTCTIRKLLVALVLVFVVSSIGFFASCKNNNDNPQSGTTFALDNSVLTLEVETSATLYSNADDPNQIVWESANESIATVSNGLVTGVTVGKTTITATYDGQESKCEVTVIESSDYPYLILDKQELNIFVGGEYTIQPKIMYKGEEASSEYSYQVLDNEICEVSLDGKITGKKAGTTTVVVSASYKNVSLQEEVTVTICKNVYSLIYAGETALELNEVQFKKDEVKQFTIKSFDGSSALTNVQYEYEYDNTKLELTNENGNFSVKGIGVGESLINISFYDDNIKYSAQLNITIQKNVVTLNDTIIVDLGDSDLLTIQLPKACQLTDGAKLYYGNEFTTELTVSDINKTQNILTVSKDSLAGMRTRAKVETADADYIFENVVLATDVISTATELKDFFKNNYAGCGNDKSKTNGLYAVLTKDIDYKGACLQDDAGFGAADQWNGTFDGNGRTIVNLTIKHGFVGFNGGNGVIKNLGLTNVVKTEANAGAIICNENSGVIDNCFVHGTVRGSYNNRAGLVQSNYKVISNCVAFINYDAYTGTNGDFNAIAINNKNTTSVIKNCYVVSNTAKYSYSNTTVNLFASESAFSKATKDTTEFNNFWVNVDTVPVFEYYKVDKLDNYLCDVDLSADCDGYRIDLSSKVTANLTSITTLDGSSLPLTITGKTFLLKKSDLATVSLGDKYLMIVSENESFVAKICIATKVLMNNDANNFKSIITNAPSGYYVLAEDMSFTTAFSTIFPAIAGQETGKTAFTGVLDGRGHKMTGINISPVDTTNGGSFSCATVIGYNRGTIKNVYVEFKTANSSNGIGFVGLNYGKVENVYAKVTIVFNKTSGRQAVAAVVAANRNGGTIQNCVGEIVLGTGVTAMFGIGTVCGSNYSAVLNNINNCYGIGQNVQYGANGATVTYLNSSDSPNAKAKLSKVYASSSALASEATFNVYNGFSRYWVVEEGTISMTGNINQVEIANVQLNNDIDLPKI